MFDSKIDRKVLEKPRAMEPSEQPSPPPSYAANPPDITAAFSNLSLRQATAKPKRDQCIAHLKLLECFHELRENVATQDGLFGIQDDFVPSGLSERDHAAFLVKIREKRWAVYVARAAMRFQSWWTHGIDVSNRMYRMQDTTLLPGAMNKALPLTDMKNKLPPIGKPLLLDICSTS